MINKSVIFVFILIILLSCKINKNTNNTPWINQPTGIPFKQYLISNNISFDTTNNSIYGTKYFDNFLKYKTRTKLEKNPFIKINQVYSFYSETEIQTFGTFIEEGKQYISFFIYTDEENFCLSTFDLSSKEFGTPENGKIKLRKPIIVQDFGDFEITNDFIKTRKRNKTPFQEWYDYQNGTIKNDTIFFKERYVGKEYKFEKKWWASRHKDNWHIIYQPNLKAVKYKIGHTLSNFEVTGEFNITK